MKLRSTSGQSNRSVLIAIFGKMTDFLATYGLVMPQQYVVMTYFSSSVAYVNGIQVAWYFKEELEPEELNSTMETNSESSCINDTESDVGILPNNKHILHPLCSGGNTNWQQTVCCQQNPKRVKLLKCVVIGFLCLDLVLFLYGLIWATESFFSLFAPIAIISVVTISYLAYNTNIYDKICVLKNTRNKNG